MLATYHFLLREEIIFIIANKVCDVVFETKMDSWTKISRCLNNKCTNVSHMSQSDINFAVSKGRLESLEKGYNRDAEDDHQARVREYYAKLWNLGGESKSRLAKCAKVRSFIPLLRYLLSPNVLTLNLPGFKIFAQDFGIRPYFMVQTFHEWTNDTCIERTDIDSIRAKAFLTLPLVLGPITYGIEPKQVSVSVCKTIPSSVLYGRGDERLRRFNAAMNVLKLRPCNLKEEEESLGEDEEESLGGDMEKSLAEDVEKSLGENEKPGGSEEWPQLMMLGYGEVESWAYEFW